MNKNTIYNIDALEGLNNTPANSIDFILTDPPYGIADNNKRTKVGGKFVSTQEAWGNDFQDSWKDEKEYWAWLKPFILQFERVLKDDSNIILFLDRKLTGLIAYLIEDETSLKFRNKLYFNKVNPLPCLRNNNYRSCIEEALWMSKGKASINFTTQKEMRQVFDGPIGRKTTQHPTEKYRWMIEPLIKNHSKEGDIVLDAFSGSGSVMAYARELNRNVIGFEKSQKFYDMSCERFTTQKLDIAFA